MCSSVYSLSQVAFDSCFQARNILNPHNQPTEMNQIDLNMWKVKQEILDIPGETVFIERDDDLKEEIKKPEIFIKEENVEDESYANMIPSLYCGKQEVNMHYEIKDKEENKQVIPSGSNDVNFTEAVYEQEERSPEKDGLMFSITNVGEEDRHPQNCGAYQKDCNKHIEPSKNCSDIIYHKCECGMLFESKPALLRHFKSHKPLGTFTCDICQMSCTRKPSLLAHMRAHSNTEFHKCEICGKLLRSEKNLCDHLAAHCFISIFTCDICGKLFKRKQHLSMHMATHSNIRTQSCHICGKSFKYKGSLHNHVETHRPHNFICNVCGMSFATKYLLSYHLFQHSDVKERTCNICGQLFNSKGGMNYHFRMHNRVGNITCFPCHICRKSCSTKLDLLKHTEKHGSKKLCNVCYKPFIRNEGLKIHAQAHMDLMRNTCSVCTETFDDFGNLYNHVMNHIMY